MRGEGTVFQEGKEAGGETESSSAGHLLPPGSKPNGGHWALVYSLSLTQAWMEFPVLPN